MARMTSDARKLSLIISWGIIDFVWAISSMFFIITYLLFDNQKDINTINIALNSGADFSNNFCNCCLALLINVPTELVDEFNMVAISSYDFSSK